MTDTTTSGAGPAIGGDPPAEAAKTEAPMRADARRNRGRILEAAAAVFEEEGVAVPVDVIARRAGVGAGTLYRHFPTKEALFEAVVIQHIEGLADIACSLAETGDAGPALFQFLQVMAGEGMTKRNLIDAIAGTGMDVHVVAAGPKSRLEAAAQRLLSDAQDVGEVRPDVNLADVFGLVMGACTFASSGDDACSPNRMMSVVCSGLRPPH